MSNNLMKFRPEDAEQDVDDNLNKENAKKMLILQDASQSFSIGFTITFFVI